MGPVPSLPSSRSMTPCRHDARRAWRTLVSFSAMVQQLHERHLHLADRQDGPAAPHLPAENPDQDGKGKRTRQSSDGSPLAAILSY